MEQLSIINIVPKTLKQQLNDSITELIKGEESFVNNIHVSENKDHSVSIKAKSFLAAKVFPKKDRFNLEFKSKYNGFFNDYNIIPLKDEMSRIVYSSIEDLVDVSYQLSAIAILVLSELGGDGFGCCSRYQACSDAKECLHPDKLFAFACKYRENLEQGKIFYGKNKNIP